MNFFDYCLHKPWITVGDDVQYKIIDEGYRIILAFQGSNSLSDWKANFDFWAEPYSNMPIKWYAHREFINKWKSAREQIFDAVLPLLGTKQFIIAGYSHGADLTILAHEDFTFNNYEPESFAYAPSRVVWLPKKTIRNRFENLHCIRTGGDIFTHLPPALFGYRRVGHDEKIGPSKLFLGIEYHEPDYYEKYL